MPLPMTEFARRLCAEAHPFLSTTGLRTPCGTHIAEANRLWSLVNPEGNQTLGVILAIRTEQGLAIDLNSIDLRPVNTLGDHERALAAVRPAIEGDEE